MLLYVNSISVKSVLFGNGSKGFHVGICGMFLIFSVSAWHPVTDHALPCLTCPGDLLTVSYMLTAPGVCRPVVAASLHVIQDPFLEGPRPALGRGTPLNMNDTSAPLPCARPGGPGSGVSGPL